MSESTVSNRLRSLEDTLTVSLFQRSSEGVVPTNAGVEFFTQAREALRILDLAITEAAAASRGSAGHLTIGVFTSLSIGKLRDAIASFINEHPKIELRLIEGSRSRMIEGLNARTIDITVFIGPPDYAIGEALPLWRENAFAIMPSQHPLVVEPAIEWKRLARETLLLSTRDAGPEADSALIARLGGPGSWPDRRKHSVNRDTLLTLVAMGRGVAVMIESDLGYLPAGVVAIPLHEPEGPTRERLTAYRDPGNDNPALRRFWSLLKSRYAESD